MFTNFIILILKDISSSVSFQSSPSDDVVEVDFDVTQDATNGVTGVTVATQKKGIYVLKIAPNDKSKK